MTQPITRRQALGSVGLAVCALGTGMAHDFGREEMVLVPAGPCLVGTTEEEAQRLSRQYGFHVSWLGGETPQRRVDLPAFLVDMYPVTNRQYHAFCQATGHPPRAHWLGAAPPPELLDHPVVMVNLDDCLAYARWAGKRLPTEEEWEKAARGPDGLLYPWGRRFDSRACWWNKDVPGASPGAPSTAPVTAHPRGASPYGVLDMCGNAAEWVAGSPGPGSGIIKGGCWMTETPLHLRPAARGMSGFANNQSHFVGFRCAKDVPR